MSPILFLLAPPRLAIEIEAPRTVSVGEPFRVVARLVNRSEAPVLVVRPQVYGHELGLAFGGGLFQGGKIVSTTIGGLGATQWELPQRYGPDLFQTLAPGEGVEIENVVYRQAYAKPFSGLKRDLLTTPTKDLAPGDYTARFSYGFRPEFHVNRNRRSGPKPELTPQGRALYRKAWVGAVEGTWTVAVRGA